MSQNITTTKYSAPEQIDLISNLVSYQNTGRKKQNARRIINSFNIRLISYIQCE